MTKSAHLLTSLFFTLACAAVWYAWRLGDGLLSGLSTDFQPSRVWSIARLIFPWVLALPVPAVIYSAVLMDRVELYTEKTLLYVVIIALLSLVLFMGTVILFLMEIVRNLPTGAPG